MKGSVCVCVYVAVWVLCTCVCVAVCRGFVMAGFATLYDTSGPSWTSKNNGNTPHFTQPPLRVGLAVF